MTVWAWLLILHGRRCFLLGSCDFHLLSLLELDVFEEEFVLGLNRASVRLVILCHRLCAEARGSPDDEVRIGVPDQANPLHDRVGQSR